MRQKDSYPAGHLELQQILMDHFQSDPRTIPSDLVHIVPFLVYGDFQVDSGAASFIAHNLSNSSYCWSGYRRIWIN